MRETRYSGSRVRSVVAAIITNDTVLAKLADKWPPEGRFGSPGENWIGGQCVDYFKRFGKAPGRAIENMFEEWDTKRGTGKEEDAQSKIMEKILRSASAEYERTEKIDADFALQMAEQVFNEVRLRQLADQEEIDLDTGDVAKALERRAAFVPFSLNGRTEYPLHGMEDLLTGPYAREEYLIDKTLVAGQPCIVAGPEKSMKTSIMLDLAVSLASGDSFLNELEVLRPANVLLMSGESGLATLKKNLRTIYRCRCGRGGRDRGLASLPKRFTLSDAVPQIADHGHLKRMQKLMQQEATEVLIVDPASMAMPGKDASNLIIMQGMLHGMADVCRELGVTFILVHHTHARQDQYKPPTLQDIAFAGFKEFARQWILVCRSEPYEPPEADQHRVHALWLNCGGSAGHSSLWGLKVDEGTSRRPRWEVTLTGATVARVEGQSRERARNLDLDKPLVLDALRQFPEGETSRELQKPTHLNWPRLKAAINSLVEEGKAEACEIRRGNKQIYRGFKVIT